MFIIIPCSSFSLPNALSLLSLHSLFLSFSLSIYLSVYLSHTLTHFLSFYILLPLFNCCEEWCGIENTCVYSMEMPYFNSQYCYRNIRMFMSPIFINYCFTFFFITMSEIFADAKGLVNSLKFHGDRMKGVEMYKGQTDRQKDIYIHVYSTEYRLSSFSFFYRLRDLTQIIYLRLLFKSWIGEKYVVLVLLF